MNDALFLQAGDLVKSTISGSRKGLPNIPSYKHSFDVAEILRSFGFSDEVVLAGLLHDVYEDGNVSFEELLRLGFSSRVVDLVRLCSFDKNLPVGDIRWEAMIDNLTKTNDREAWAIKIADIIDNIADSFALSPERTVYMLEVKGPKILSLTKKLLADNPLWQELEKELKKHPV